jgi:thiol-disulfide isomerase/thioredoxin
MKKIIYTLLILVSPLIAYNKVNFYKGSLNDVKRTAAIEGKLYFVDFYASYCLPCKLMDQTTFMDEELGNYVAQNYIPLKLNIDAFDAYEIRADYEVQELPTIMIFSSSGILLDTYKGSLTATALRQFLRKHDLPKNRQMAKPPKKETFADEVAISNTNANTPKPTKPNVNKVVTKTTKPNINKVLTKPTKPNINKVVTKPINRAKPIISNTNTSLNTNTKITKPNKPVVPTKVNTNNNTIVLEKKPVKTSNFKAKVKKIMPNNTITLQPKPKEGAGLYEFTSKKHPLNGYGVQIGLFAEYGNVLTEVEKIQLKFPGKKVLVHITEFKGKVVYRVMVGTFPSYDLARNYLPQIKANGFEAFIKDLSILK